VNPKTFLFPVFVCFALCACSTKNNHAEKKTKPEKTDSIKPFTIGVIEEIQSAVLNETRILNIYLPAGYKSGTTYPVIYLLDGGADEDFIHVAGLVQYSSFDWIHDIEPSIVVGISNTDRKRDFTYPSTVEAQKKEYPTTGHSDKFITFIETELQPFIEKKFNIQHYDERTLIGQSLGGLLATEILLKKPYLFSKYIIVSPSLWWDNGSLLDVSPHDLKQQLPQETLVYVGVGKEGLTPGKPARIMENDAKMLFQKIQSAENKNIKAYFDYLPKEDHATIGHQAMMNAFRMFGAEKRKK
jgi:uncharacterized protein